jgi:DNA polymerase-3 subunit epsilon
VPDRSVGGLPGAPRRSRGAGWRQGSYAALDFETTGLDYRADTVVSFGVVPVDAGRVAMRGAVRQLIRPHVPPSPRSQTIHELRPQDLVEAPSLDEARATLRRALDGRFLLVWFAEVEVNFLAGIFGGSPRRWRRRTIDVRNLAMAVAGEPVEARERPGYPLGGTARRWDVPVSDPHEALDDALVAAQLFLVLVSKLPGRHQPTVRDLLRVGGARQAR